MTSKLHGIRHSKGGPLRLRLGEGQCSGFTGADVVLKDLPPAAPVVGDKGYDRDTIRQMCQSRASPLTSHPAAVSSQSMTTRGWIEWVTKSRRSFPDRRTGGPLQPATIPVPHLSLCYPSSRCCPLLVMSPDPKLNQALNKVSRCDSRARQVVPKLRSHRKLPLLLPDPS